MTTKTVHVAAAVLKNSRGDVLLAQRPAGKSMAGLWEFPGGKIEPGETPQAALARELKEELELSVSGEDMSILMTVSHNYPDFHLTMHVFLCSVGNRNVYLKEHQNIAWVSCQDMGRYPMPPADIPVVERLQKDI